MKRVLVTGASGVLGGAVARYLREKGFSIYAHGFQNAPFFPQSFQADLRDESQVSLLFQYAQPDYVVHCAGFSQDASLLATSVEVWRQTLDTNAGSAFLVARESLRILPRGGQLILVSSRIGMRGSAGQSAYAASKGMVLGLTQSAASEGTRHRIAVNAVFPGFHESPMTHNLKPPVLAARQRENLIRSADAAFSLGQFCAFLLGLSPAPSGQIFSPDCRI